MPESDTVLGTLTRPRRIAHRSRVAIASCNKHSQIAKRHGCAPIVPLTRVIQLLAYLLHYSGRGSADNISAGRQNWRHLNAKFNLRNSE